METLLTEAVKQVPALAIVVGLVWWMAARFIDFLGQEREHRERISAEHNQAMKEAGNACHIAQVDMAKRFEAISDRNTAALDRNTEMLGKCSAALDRSHPMPMRPTPERQV